MPLSEVPSYLKKHIHAKRQWELLPYNDCFYRNLYLYEYIALLDIDEVIIPSMNYSSWELMMEAAVHTSLRVRNVSRASYNFKTVYFLDEMQPKSLANIPDYLHMMQHVVRSSDVIRPKNYYDKSFFNPEKVLLVHNHTPLACLGDRKPGAPALAWTRRDFAALEAAEAFAVARALKALRPRRLGAAGGGELDPREAARPLAGGRGHGVRHRCGAA